MKRLTGEERISFEDGELDEIFFAGGVHLERLDKKNWFLNCIRKDGSSVAIFFTSKDLKNADRVEERCRG